MYSKRNIRLEFLKFLPYGNGGRAFISDLHTTIFTQPANKNNLKTEF